MAGAPGGKSNRYARTQKSSNIQTTFFFFQLLLNRQQRFNPETRSFLRLMLTKLREKKGHRIVWFVFAAHAQTLVSCFKLLVKEGFFSPNDTQSREKCEDGRSTSRWQTWKVVRSIAAVRQRPRTPWNWRCSSASFESSFDISMQNRVQRWSSDFQGLFRVKIRKMALGSNDLSTLPLRQDPLDLSFWSYLTFLHYGIDEVERHLLWKCHKKIQMKSWSNVPPKLLACITFLYKVVHKNGRLWKFNRSREIEFNSFTASTIFMKLGTLVHHVHGYKTLPQNF